jgi:hypothetical protein
MLLNLLNAVTNVRIVALFFQISSHSQLEILQRVNQHIPRSTNKSLGNVFGQFVLFVLEPIGELVNGVEHGVFENGDFEASENGSDSKVSATGCLFI